MEGENLALAHVRRLADPAPVGRAHACKHLAQLAAQGDQTRAKIREARAVQGLLPLLHAANTQAEAAQALAALAVDAETRVLMRAEGGCAPLVQALQSKTIAAQEEAARALGHLARDEDGRVEIAQLGGIAALVELLQHDDRDMQLAAAEALNQLARNAETRVTIVGADGHDAMIEILRGGETPAPPRLQAAAAGTLASLAFYGPNKRKIREGGGLERLIGVLDSSSLEVADAAAAALSRLTKNDAECQAAVSVADGVRQLAALLSSEGESTRQHARAAIENIGANPEDEKAAWAKAKAEEKTGTVAQAEKLREKADESLLVGELDAAAATYTEALALHPRSTLLQRRLARTERERVSASSSIDRLAARTAAVRQTRHKLASKAPDPLKLPGMPDGVLSLIEQFRAVDSRRQRHGVAAHRAPSFTSSRQQLDEATAQLDAAQSALYRRSVESTPPDSIPPTSSSTSRIGTNIGDGYTAFAVGKEDTLLPPDVLQLIQRRDDARRSFVQAADTFLSRMRSEAFQESHEAAMHVMGPLQHAADKLGSVPMLGPTALGDEAEAFHDAEQGIGDDDYRGAEDGVSGGQRRTESTVQKTKKYPEAAALVAFDRWIAENTAVTVGSKTEEAIARLLSCVSDSLALGTSSSEQAQSKPIDSINTNANTSQQDRLLQAVREADTRLAVEQRYWQLADPIRSLPVGVIRRSAGALLQEIASQIEEVEAIYSYAELIEERRDAAMECIEREDRDETPGVTELVEYSDLARACAEEMEEVTVTITTIRNELEQTRDNRRLQEMESKAKALRRRRYEAEKGLKAERKRLCQLAAEHYPELPLRFPGAGLRLDPQSPSLSSGQEQPGEADSVHPEDAGKGRAVHTINQGQNQDAIIEDLNSAAQGLGDALETEAAEIAKMRERLMDAERKLLLNRTTTAEQRDSNETAESGVLQQGGSHLAPSLSSQSAVLDDEDALLRRQRRDLLRRQRSFSLKCELAGRSAPRSVAAASRKTDNAPEGTVSLSDFLGGRTPKAVPEPEPEPEPEYHDSPTIAASTTSGRHSSSASRPPRSARQTSPPRTMSSLSRATASPTPVGSEVEMMSKPVSISVASRASSSPTTETVASPTRSATGRYPSSVVNSEEPRLLNGNQETSEIEDTGEEALAGARNATMKAAAKRAEQRLRLRPESETSTRSDLQVHSATRTTIDASESSTELIDAAKPLTRLERARQQASARISTGEHLIAARDSGAGETQHRRTRSPSPPRTLSARIADAQQGQGQARSTGSGIAAGHSSSVVGSPAFRQPRTASELNSAPTPPPMSPFLDTVEELPVSTDSLAGGATDRLSRSQYAGYSRGTGGTTSYPQYSAGMPPNNLRTASAASVVGWSAPPASPMPTLSVVSERAEVTTMQKTTSRMDLLAAARAKLERG